MAYPWPDWRIAPPGGFTAEDLDRIPDLPPHTELVDGNLVFVSPQTRFHMRVLKLLERKLDDACPDGYEVVREQTVRLGPKDRPEPDLMLVGTEGDTGPEQTWYSPEHVLLAVEVVSPDSEQRDRKRKPELYAHAGIPHFWRVESNGGSAVVYVYELDPATNSYTPTGIHHGVLEVEIPLRLKLELDHG